MKRKTGLLAMLAMIAVVMLTNLPGSGPDRSLALVERRSSQEGDHRFRSGDDRQVEPEVHSA